MAGKRLDPLAIVTFILRTFVLVKDQQGGRFAAVANTTGEWFRAPIKSRQFRDVARRLLRDAGYEVDKGTFVQTFDVAVRRLKHERFHELTKDFRLSRAHRGAL